MESGLRILLEKEWEIWNFEPSNHRLTHDGGSFKSKNFFSSSSFVLIFSATKIKLLFYGKKTKVILSNPLSFSKISNISHQHNRTKKETKWQAKHKSNEMQYQQRKRKWDRLIDDILSLHVFGWKMSQNKSNRSKNEE